MQYIRYRTLDTGKKKRRIIRNMKRSKTQKTKHKIQDT